MNGEKMSVSGHIYLSLFSHIFKETFNNSTNNGDVSRRAIGFVPKTRRAVPSIARRRADPRDPNRAVGIAIGASRIPGRPPARAFASPDPQRFLENLKKPSHGTARFVLVIAKRTR